MPPYRVSRNTGHSFWTPCIHQLLSGWTWKVQQPEIIHDVFSVLLSNSSQTLAFRARPNQTVRSSLGDKMPDTEDTGLTVST